MTVQRYSWQEALERIYRLFRGDSPNEAPEALTPPRYSHDETLSRFAELLAGSLPGETASLPSAVSVVAGSLPDSSTTAEGVVELATNAEALAGADTTRPIVPSAHAYAHQNGIGAQRLGSGANYISVDANGDITLYGNAELGDYVYVPFGAMVAPASGGPGLEAFKTNLLLYWFDKDTPESLYFTVAMPAGYKAGSNVGMYVDWLPKTASTGTVTWRLEYSLARFDEAATNLITLFGSGDGDAGDLGAGTFYSTYLGAITGTVSSLSEWDYIAGRVLRDASGTYGGDSYDDDAGLLGVTLLITKDTLGL